MLSQLRIGLIIYLALLTGQCVAHPIFGVFSEEKSDSDFLGLLGLALLSKQYIFVADSGSNLLYRMDDMEGTGLISYDGSALGTPFSNPSGIAMDSLGRIYVASNARVYRFDDMLGTNQVEYDGNAVGNPFTQIKGLFIDSQDRIYATDNTNDRIYRFDDMQGAGQVEIASGFFNNPQGIAADSSGNVYVSDTGTDTVMLFPDMGTSGSSNYNGNSMGTPFSNPFNVALDADGNIYVSCIGNGLYSFSDMSGSNQAQNNVTTSYGQPRGLTLDASNRIYFSEFTDNNRIYRMDTVDGSGIVFYGPFSQPIYIFVSQN